MWTARIVCLTGVFLILTGCSKQNTSADDDDSSSDVGGNSSGGSSKGRGGSSSKNTGHSSSDSSGDSNGNGSDDEGSSDANGSGGKSSTTQKGIQAAADTARGGSNSSTGSASSASSKGGANGTSSTGAAASRGGSGTGTGAGGTGLGDANGNAGKDSNGAPTDNRQCADQSAETTAKPVVLEFVIDKTGSFHDLAYPDDPNNKTSKWAEMLNVLPQAFDSLPETWAVGTTYFSLDNGKPNDPNACYVGKQATPIAPRTQQQLDALKATIPQDCAGATPTNAAWEFGLSQIVNWQPPPEYADSPRYIVLITDGIPTVKNTGCYGDVILDSGEIVHSNGAYAISQPEYNRMLDNVTAKGQAANVKTFVVGVLGSQNPQGADYDPLYMLSKFAEAGGTAKANCTSAPGTPSGDVVNPRGTYCHFDMTTDPDFANGLKLALRAIVTTMVGCTYQVPVPESGLPIDLTKTSVIYHHGDASTGDAGEPLQQSVGDTPCADGLNWYFSKTDAMGNPIELQLCPDTCTRVGSDYGANIQITYKCLEVG